VGANPDGNLGEYPHHKSSFDFNTEALFVGTSITLRIVEEILTKLGK